MDKTAVVSCMLLTADRSDGGRAAADQEAAFVGGKVWE